MDYLREVFKSVPSKLNNISTKTLNEVGNDKIQTLAVFRLPLKDHWNKAINAIGLGKFDELKRKNNLPILYHVGLIATINQILYVIEKNEVINIERLKPDPKIEVRYITVPKDLTLNKIMSNTLLYMGEHKFYDYDGLGENNCQNFTKALLSSNGLNNMELEKFYYQDLTPLIKDIKNSPISFLPNALKKITETGSFVSRLIGKGQDVPNVFDHKYVKFVKHNKFKLF